jgi:type VII secretion-associated serine protease mycosin
MRPDLVWPLTRGEGILVAVIDSGVAKNHPALAGQVVPGFDFVTGGGDGTCDEAGHGTMIAGIIAGVDSPTSGFHGMAPAAKIMSLRVLRTREKTTDENQPVMIANAIRMATDKGAKVINLSLTTAPVPELTEAVRYAIAHDVVLVAAAGNDGEPPSDQPDKKEYPAAYEGVIAVGGVDQNGDHVQSSTPGDYVDIAAPGLEIEGPAPRGGGYLVEPAGGTSFAAAYITGTVALVRAYRSDLKGPDIVQRILRTADRPANGWDRDVGFGVVNPYWAVVSVAAEEDVQAPPGQVSLPAPKPDPGRGVRLVAVWTVLLASVLTACVLMSTWVLTSGRSRRWRPGRPKAEPDD